MVAILLVARWFGGEVTVNQCKVQWKLNLTKGPRDWKSLFATMRFRCIKVLFHIFYYYWGRENSSLYQGLQYIDIC